MSRLQIEHGTYVGPHEGLRGCKALLMWKGDVLLAQFDGFPDGSGPTPQLVHPVTRATLCFGWHKFDPLDFRFAISTLRRNG